MNTTEENTHPALGSDAPAWILISGFTLVTSITSFFLTVYFKEDLGFSGSQIGVLFAIWSLTGILVAMPTGLGNDRITSRTLLLSSLVVLAIGFVLMATTSSYIPYLVVFFLWTSANALFKLSLDVQILKSGTRENNSKRICRYQTWRFFGLCTGTALSGFLIEELNFRLSLLVVAGAILLLLWPTSLLKPTKVGKQKFLDYKSDLSNPAVLFFAAWIFLFTTHWGAEMTCYGLFLREDFGFSFREMGLYMGGEFFAMMMTFFFLGRNLTETTPLRKIAILGLLASGLGHMGQVFEPVWLSFCFRFMHGIGDALVFALFYIGIFRLFKIERMGGNAGLMSMMSMLGMVTGSLIYSPLGASYGYGIPIFVSGALTLLLIIPFYTKRYRNTIG